MAKKQVIRLTESDLHRIIKESVNNVLTELDWKTYANAARLTKDRDYRSHTFADKAAREFNKKHSINNSNINYNNPSVGEYEIKNSEITSDDILNASTYNQDVRNTDDNTFRYGDIPLEINKISELTPDTAYDEWFGDAIDDETGEIIPNVHYKIPNSSYNTERSISRPFIDSWGRGQKPRHNPFNEYDDNEIKNSPLYKQSVKQNYDANTDFGDYINGKTKYVKGKGWIKK